MSLSHSILASLIGDRPCSGYDLAKEFNTSVGFFWKATHQQIYRELAHLEAQGFVESERIAQEDRPDKKVYSVTEAGKKYLLEWIALPSEPSPIKEELHVKMHVGHLVPRSEIIGELRRQRKIHQEKLSLYREKEKQFYSERKGLSLKGKYRYLNLKSGIMHEKSRISWFDEAISFLSRDED